MGFILFVKIYNYIGDFMRMSDLQAKDIVSTKDGRRIGRIVDLVVNSDGYIDYLVVEPTKFLKRYASFGSETNVKFQDIVKFGNDVILVDL